MNPTLFRSEVEHTLHHNILNFWLEKMQDPSCEGFYGRMDGMGRIYPTADRGAILNARILWAFSAAYRLTGKRRYLKGATRAKEYLLNHFIDSEQGGIFWSLRADGSVADGKKQIYALGFAIYGLSEYYRITEDEKALQAAQELYRHIEQHSHDRELGGYFEAFTRHWEPIEDMRLSEKDANECKTMNTHLHILEPYTNLYRVWPDAELKANLKGLIELFLERIYDPKTGHLGLFFDQQWVRKDKGCSYGHDIEAAWLLLEAAEVVGDESLLARVKQHAHTIAQAADEGLQSDGSMIYEVHDDGHVVRDRHWWVQAESVVGHLWMWRKLGEQQGYEKAERAWTYIREQLLDPVEGEWYWARMEDGSIDRQNDKAGFWKCPYHNTRMCLEAMELLK